MSYFTKIRQHHRALSITAVSYTHLDVYKRQYFHRMGRNNVYSLAKFLWSIDLRPIADKLTKDYLVI